MSNDNSNSSLTIHMLKQLLLSFLFRKDSTRQTDAKFRLLSKLPQRKQNNILWQTHCNLSYFLEMGGLFLTHIAPQTFFHSLLWEYILVFQESVSEVVFGRELGPLLAVFGQQFMPDGLVSQPSDAAMLRYGTGESKERFICYLGIDLGILVFILQLSTDFSLVSGGGKKKHLGIFFHENPNKSSNSLIVGFIAGRC